MILDKLTLVWWFGFMLVKILSIGLAALKNVAHFKRGQKRTENIHFVTLSKVQLKSLIYMR